MIIPSTTISVLRTPDPAPTDDYGDEVDTADVAQTGIPAWLGEQQQRSYSPATGQVTILTKYVCALRPGAHTVQETDRIKDERTGIIYAIDSMLELTGFMAGQTGSQTGPLQLMLSRVA